MVCTELFLSVFQFVHRFEQRLMGGSNSLTLVECEHLLSQVKSKFPYEYKVCDCIVLNSFVFFLTFFNTLHNYKLVDIVLQMYIAYSNQHILKLQCNILVFILAT